MTNDLVSVRAVIVKDDKILTLRRDFYDGDTIWVFPGGHMEDQDKSEIEALKREIFEEANIQIKIGKLIFTQDFKGQLNHFYLCEIIGGKVGYGNGPEYNRPEQYRGEHHPQWLEIKKLDQYDLRPKELKEKIIKLAKPAKEMEEL